MKADSNLKLTFDSAEHAVIFYQSFMPEFYDTPMKRSVWTIKRAQDGDESVPPNEVHFEINSKDLTAYRATINSLIIFANMVEKTLHLVETEDT